MDLDLQPPRWERCSQFLVVGGTARLVHMILCRRSPELGSLGRYLAPGSPQCYSKFPIGMSPNHNSLP
jgi:hypothetical protein